MHQHRLVLHGPAAAVARLSAALQAAGAVVVGRRPDGRSRLVWATSRADALAPLCAHHRAVTVSVERFELLGDELQRLVICGHETTLLERREPTVDGWHGLAFEDDGVPLDPLALRSAARRVVAIPVALAPGPASSAVDDAVLLGRAVGGLCAAVEDPAAGVAGAGDAVARLAAVALTIAASGVTLCHAELAFERAWRLTQATAYAGREELWTRPGEADWHEWLMDLLTGAAWVIDGAAACLHQPPAPFVSIHAEHFATEEEQVERAALRLVATALQVLVLFDAGPVAADITI